MGFAKADFMSIRPFYEHKLDSEIQTIETCGFRICTQAEADPLGHRKFHKEFAAAFRPGNCMKANS